MKFIMILSAACGMVISGLAELTVDEIVSRANQAAYYAGEDGQAEVEMKIFDRSGSLRTREFSILRMDVADGNQKFYVFFRKPAELYKQVFLVWKEVNADKEDSRWMWLPALNLKRSIAPGDKRISFVGSDFVYEDVSGRNLNEDSHELIESTETQYVVKNTPRKPASVEFAYYLVRIDKESFLPRKAEYFDKNGKLYRTVEATKVESIQGFPTVVESVVKDFNTGGSTVNVFSGIKYNIGLKESLFTERFLRRPPREVMR